MSRARGRGEMREYGQMVVRLIRSWGRAFEHAGDEEELGQLLALHEAADLAIRDAVERIRARGSDVNWASIGRMAGITRQAARQRWDDQARAVQTRGRRLRAGLAVEDAAEPLAEDAAQLARQA